MRLAPVGGQSARRFSAANAVQASCSLIGAYWHNYLMEQLLGRVTRYLLTHARLPLMIKR
ncbi:universal stress protein [Sinorhizobium alkalisoli]|uniref:universal stress protein n=1 Tax=Sinorhizobium alkalisoli TaxID=1752398 RepID=UPI00124E3812|nr:universal stress protein [Sinorhizobium alkalisoli]